MVIDTLQAAGKNYSRCARNVQRRVVANQPTAHESEQLIAFGIASDWTRRAAALVPISYRGRLMNRSNRSPGVSDLLRFNLAWFGMNAIFSRESVRDLLGSCTDARSELKRFRFICARSGIAEAAISARKKILDAILDCEIQTRIPDLALGTRTTTLHALFYKYTPSDQQEMPGGKAIKTALESGSLASLDMPS